MSNICGEAILPLVTPTPWIRDFNYISQMKVRPQILNSDVDMKEILLLASLNLTDFFRVCFQCKPLSSAL